MESSGTAGDAEMEVQRERHTGRWIGVQGLFIQWNEAGVLSTAQISSSVYAKCHTMGSALVSGSTETHFSHCLLLPPIAGSVLFTCQTFTGIHISDVVNRLLALLFTQLLCIWLPNDLARSNVCFLFCLIQLHRGTFFFLSHLIHKIQLRR